MNNIFIINGTGGCGKDTFVSLVNEFIPVKHISIVDKVKNLARMAEWNGGKTEKDRKFLSDLKIAIDNYNDENYNYVKNVVDNFKNGLYKESKALFIDMREPEQIKRAVKDFNANTILIKRDSIKDIKSNIADASVYDMVYDVEINNSGTLEELKDTAKGFVDECIKGDRLSYSDPFCDSLIQLYTILNLY